MTSCTLLYIFSEWIGWLSRFRAPCSFDWRAPASAPPARSRRLLRHSWSRLDSAGALCEGESGKVCVKTLEYAIDVDDVELESEVNNLKTRQIHVSIWILWKRCDRDRKFDHLFTTCRCESVTCFYAHALKVLFESRWYNGTLVQFEWIWLFYCLCQPVRILFYKHLCICLRRINRTFAVLAGIECELCRRHNFNDVQCLSAQFQKRSTAPPLRHHPSVTAVHRSHSSRGEFSSKQSLPQREGVV